MKTNTQTTSTTDQTITAYSKMIAMYDKLHNFLNEWGQQFIELDKLDTLDPHDLVDCDTTNEEWNTYVEIAKREIQIFQAYKKLYDELFAIDVEVTNALEWHEELSHPQIDDDLEELYDLPF